jgi:hypothetical protein
MALSVIGAGFGRTGTMSMKIALEMLDLGPCHHMANVISNPEQLALWRRAAQGELPNWDGAYAGFRSAVDWPTSYYWRELSTQFPDAKVVLTVRSFDSWYASMSRTLWPLLRPGNDPSSFGVKIISGVIFGGRFEDRAYVQEVYDTHIATVKATLSPDRLLTFDVADGWAPLCRFLNKPIPDVPFPTSNTTDEFRAKILSKGSLARSERRGTRFRSLGSEPHLQRAKDMEGQPAARPASDRPSRHGQSAALPLRSRDRPAAPRPSQDRQFRDPT